MNIVSGSWQTLCLQVRVRPAIPSRLLGRRVKPVGSGRCRTFTKSGADLVEVFLSWASMLFTRFSFALRNLLLQPVGVRWWRMQHVISLIADCCLVNVFISRLASVWSNLIIRLCPAFAHPSSCDLRVKSWNRTFVFFSCPVDGASRKGSDGVHFLSVRVSSTGKHYSVERLLPSRPFNHVRRIRLVVICFALVLILLWITRYDLPASM